MTFLMTLLRERSRVSGFERAEGPVRSGQIRPLRTVEDFMPQKLVLVIAVETDLDHANEALRGELLQVPPDVSCAHPAEG